jgi:glycosyltransferase involved in cell wall biosynthesis
MRILKVWDADYPWDIRVEKVVKTIVQAGHEVHLVCRNEKRLPRLETDGLFHIHRLPGLPAAFGRLNRLLNFPYFFNPVWVQTLLRVARQKRPDVILVRDLPLAITGIYAARTLKIPIVLDMAENYPAMLRDLWRLGSFRFSNVFVRNPFVAEWVERYTLARVDHIIVVVEESASRLVRLGIDHSKISVVSNTPPCKRAEILDHLARPADLPEGDPILMYLGNLDPGRGVDTLIAAMPAVLQVAPNARLVLIGTGSQLTALKSQAHALEVQEAVNFLGWVPHRSAQSYLAHSDICVIPHDSTESNNTTISNKLFDYMAAGKPVVVSDCPPSARIVRSVGCGVDFRSRNPPALAEKIGQLLNSGERLEMGKRGWNAVRREYNWDRDSQVLINALISMTMRAAKPPTILPRSVVPTSALGDQSPGVRWD